jgi:hypothetical protein
MSNSAAPISALVVLLDAAQSAARAQSAFQAMGFAVGPCVGTSFSIEASPEVFKQVFDATLAQRTDGVMLVDGQPAPAHGLSLQHLPASCRSLISAVLFSEPPAFGPTSP